MAKPRPDQTGPQIQVGITKDNYFERAAAFVASQESKQGFVIRVGTKEGPATPDQWIAWVRYFHAKKIPSSWLESHMSGTVPTEWPEQFDAEASTSERRSQPR